MSFCKDSLLKNKLNIVYILGLLFVIISILAYKYSIISSYVVNVADEDQAIMWYGTMAALDNNIREPHFIGQRYGSMIEAYVAIPFYLLGMPIEYALPMATVFLWILPFVLCSIALAKNNQWFEAVIILGMSMIYSWQYDVLTNISRSFIGGFWLTFLGILLLLKEKKTAKDIFGIVIFFVLGFWVSEQTFTIVALCICHVLYNEEFFTHPKNFFLKFKKWDKDKKFALILGLILAIIFLGYCNYLFYYLNPDYNHHHIGSFRPDKKILIYNLKHLGELFDAYSFISIMGIPISTLIVLGIFFAFWKKYGLNECFFLFILTIIGILLIMCSKKSVDFIDTLLVDKRRLYLFVPYIGIFLAYLSFKSKNLSNLVISKFGTKIMFCVFGILVLFIIGITNIKTNDFQNKYVFDEEINASDILRVQRVNAIKNVAKEVGEIAKKNNIQNVIFLENCTYAYGTAAFNYGEIRTYLTYYERKTEDYLFFKNHPYTGKILFVNCDAKGVLSYKIEEFEKCNVIEYIVQKYFRQRDCYILDELYQKDCM